MWSLLGGRVGKLKQLLCAIHETRSDPQACSLRLKIHDPVVWNSTLCASVTRFEASRISSDTRLPAAS